MAKKQQTPLPNMMAIYIRVSTDKQVLKGVSLRDQRDIGIETAKSIGWSYEVFEDGGVSGRLSSKDRPEFFRLMNLIEERKIGAFCLIDMDRLSRSDEGQALITTLKHSGVRIFEGSKEIDLNDSSIEAMVRMKAIFASFEVENRISKIKSALKKSASEGRAPGGAMVAYGYDRVDKILTINETESKVVKTIYKMSLEGSGTKVIANYLNDNNIPTKRNSSVKGKLTIRGKKKDPSKFIWKDAVVYTILTNPIYKGLRRFNDTFFPSPIIIQPDVWELVQTNLKIKNKFKKDKKYFYLLKGLVHCGHPECDNTFMGRKREDLSDNQYICTSQRDKNRWCKTRGINIDKLDKLVWTQIQELPKQIDRFFKWYEKTDQIEKVKTDFESLNDTLKNLEEEYSNLIRLGARGKINVDILDKEIDKANERIEKVKKRIESLRPQLSILDNRQSITNIVSILIEKSKQKNITDDDKQNVLRSLIDKIYIKWEDNTDKRPSPIQKISHHIKIVYKINALSQFKLGNDIEIGYKKKGWRMDNIGVLNNELMITQSTNDVLGKGISHWEHLGAKPMANVKIK